MLFAGQPVTFLALIVSDSRCQNAGKKSQRRVLERMLVDIILLKDLAQKFIKVIPQLACHIVLILFPILLISYSPCIFNTLKAAYV